MAILLINVHDKYTFDSFADIVMDVSFDKIFLHVLVHVYAKNCIFGGYV